MYTHITCYRCNAYLNEFFFLYIDKVCNIFFSFLNTVSHGTRLIDYKNTLRPLGRMWRLIFVIHHLRCHFYKMLWKQYVDFA